MKKLEKVKNSALSIQTTSQLIKLTKGQNILLKNIDSSLSKQKPITLEEIVKMYCNGVSKTHTKSHYKYDSGSCRFDKYTTHDIYESYRNNDSLFKYTLRPRIKTWFINSIGSLVVKGKLLIIPVIEEI